MNTKVVPVSQIQLASEMLQSGEPVVFPTETVYGIGAPVFDEKTINKIFSIKGRPSDNPLIAHVASIDEVFSLSTFVPSFFEKLVGHFWPGPLSFVLPKNPKVPSIVSGGHCTIAVRMPSHPVALQLIRLVGQPLAAPSANLSGRPSPTCAFDAWEDLQGRVALILDGGPCEIGIESTVLSLLGAEPIILRPGRICKEAIEEVLGCRVLLPDPEGPILSPGMKYRHYAPKAEVRLVENREDLKGAFILSSRPRQGERILNERTLYGQLREADRMGVSAIEIYFCDEVKKNAGLMNRLLKAASAK